MLWYIIHKDINEINILCFLRRSLLFANNEESEDKIIEVSVNVNIIA